MSNLSFRELKQFVSVIDVATYLGYQLDRTKGVAQPSYVLTENGDVIDRIYIKNPNDKSIQGYWRRLSNKGGDVISFVKENLDRFNITSHNDIDKINKVLHNFADRTYKPPLESSSYKKLFEKRPFDPSRWIITHDSYIREKILASRNIDKQTSLLFSDFICTIKDKESKFNYTNIGFPYVSPGSKDVIGYEIRGIGGFKSKATGTDSTKGMWIADFTKNPLEVKNLFVGESAYDLLSYFQINRSTIDLNSSVFVSFGGAFSDTQYKALIDYYTSSKPILLFDNDLYGKMYDIRAFALTVGKTIQAKLDQENKNVYFKIEEKQFSIPIDKLTLSSFLSESGYRNNGMVEIIKPGSEEIKDWNAVLQKECNTASKYGIGR